MKSVIFCLLLTAAVSGAVYAQIADTNPRPSWLLDSKRISVDHSVSFSFGTYSRSYQSLYSNSIRYALSTQLSLSGTFGYYQRGGKYKDFKSMLHGFGIIYNPNKYLRIQFHYQGISPISKPASAPRSQ